MNGRLLLITPMRSGETVDLSYGLDAGIESSSYDSYADCRLPAFPLLLTITIIASPSPFPQEISR